MKNKKGITLVSLVITIIVMLILAGVSVTIFLREDALFEKAETSTEKNRAAILKEKIELAIQENHLARLCEEEEKTKQDIINELIQDKLLTAEEADVLKDEDLITIDNIELDFSKFEDGFKYINRKYLLYSSGGTYIICDDNFNITTYNKDESIFLEVPSTCITAEPTRLTLTGTGDFDDTYTVSRDGHYIYAIDKYDGREYVVGVEVGYCTHYFKNCGNWVNYNFDDIENPQINCNTCWAEIPCKTINGVIYAYNVSLDLVLNCVDAGYDPTIDGYCALVWDKTLETVNFEDQIDGIDVTRVAGFQDYTDDDLPEVKTVTLPKRVKNITYAFWNCQKLTTVPEIPSTVTKAYSAFYNCTSLKGSIKLPCTIKDDDIDAPNATTEYYHVDSCNGTCGR